jgi:sodium transport system ATP-binding protein
MIEIDNLHKTFKTKQATVKAVDGVSFTAHDGQITGLLGPNGAGKTTTMRMLYTLMLPDQRGARWAYCRMRAAFISA